jgi:hypothetical protein
MVAAAGIYRNLRWGWLLELPLRLGQKAKPRGKPSGAGRKYGGERQADERGGQRWAQIAQS